MTKNRPKISVVMAVYNPKEDWLSQQLISISKQDFRDFELILGNDCSSSISQERLLELAKCALPDINITVFTNPQNSGSTITFERLTERADGEYIAYCDQDDIWEADKLSSLLYLFNTPGTVLSYSDVSVIDEDGKKLSDSITHLRRRHVFYEGDGLFDKLLFKNFVPGCAMLVRADIAKLALPFEPKMVHDHYLALFCSLHGTLAFTKKPLVRYRLHSKNQTSVLAGVFDKKSYIEKRISRSYDMYVSLKARFEGKGYDDILKKAVFWSGARLKYANKKYGQAINMLRYMGFEKSFTLFELFALPLPEHAFKRALSAIKGGKI